MSPPIAEPIVPLNMNEATSSAPLDVMVTQGSTLAHLSAPGDPIGIAYAWRDPEPWAFHRARPSRSALGRPRRTATSGMLARQTSTGPDMTGKMRVRWLLGRGRLGRPFRPRC